MTDQGVRDEAGEARERAAIRAVRTMLDGKDGYEDIPQLSDDLVPIVLSRFYQPVWDALLAVALEAARKAEKERDGLREAWREAAEKLICHRAVNIYGAADRMNPAHHSDADDYCHAGFALLAALASLKPATPLPAEPAEEPR